MNLLHLNVKRYTNWIKELVFSNYFSLFTIIWAFVGAEKTQPQKHSRWNSCSTEKRIHTNVTPYATIIKHKTKICACIYFVWLIKYAKQVSFPFSLAIGWAIFGWLFSSLIHTQIKINTSKRQFFELWNEMKCFLSCEMKCARRWFIVSLLIVQFHFQFTEITL